MLPVAAFEEDGKSNELARSLAEAAAVIDAKLSALVRCLVIHLLSFYQKNSWQHAVTEHYEMKRYMELLD
ncbi:hypothetical protein BDB00DRAFT_821058 [Zychaea mexicana]|uniref:uncharacterized protein n=1 Tax=Zychaea mexicana TaxID=64656 RepID=UPI0022FE9FEE|nr:uncharacterized protein BDB00DRAFT_821058 [Zychaea mexicana]KAI9493868.1 hypothetical protein BDB00DRAFT_821058 [Zychaea mexicana]